MKLTMTDIIKVPKGSMKPTICQITPMPWTLVKPTIFNYWGKWEVL